MAAPVWSACLICFRMVRILHGNKLPAGVVVRALMWGGLCASVCRGWRMVGAQVGSLCVASGLALSQSSHPHKVPACSLYNHSIYPWNSYIATSPLSLHLLWIQTCFRGMTTDFSVLFHLSYQVKPPPTHPLTHTPHTPHTHTYTRWLNFLVAQTEIQWLGVVICRNLLSKHAPR